MFKSLSTYLDSRATPEQKSVLLHACQSLADAGYTDHAGVLEQELGMADAQQQDLYYPLVYQYMIPLYQERLNEFGIQAADAAELPILTSLFNAVMCVDNWSDPWSLNDLLTDQEGPEESLADLLAAVGSHSADDYLAALETVSPDLITRIQHTLGVQMANDPELEPVAIMEGRGMCERRLRALLAVIPPDHSQLVRQYTEALGRLFVPARYILNRYYAQLVGITNKQQAAAEILLLLAASTTRTAELRLTTMGLTEQLNFDPTELTAVDATIAAHLKKAFPDENA